MTRLAAVLSRFALLSVALLSVLPSASLWGQAASSASLAGPRSPVVPQAVTRRFSTQVPILFVANQGQASAATLYSAQTAGVAVSLGRTGVTLLRLVPRAASPAPAHQTASPAGAGPSRPRSDSFSVHRQTIEFVGEDPALTVEPLDPQTARASSFLGNDRRRWVANAPTYGRVRYHNLWPGIDMVFYSHGGQLEYDFVVAAGADPNQIRLKIEGDDAFDITDQGELRIGSGKDAILHRPLLYQDIANRKRMVSGEFIKIAGETVGFRFAAYDRTRPFIIDPAINLLYSTYVGGVDDDEAFGMTLDAAGNTYIVGFSPSQNFPVTANAYSPVDPEAGIYFAIVMKFDPSGTLVFSTGLGGDGSNLFGQSNAAYAVAVDSAGDVWVGGATSTTDFPVTSGAVQSTSTGTQDAFLSELSPDGSSLLYSTYFGGTGLNFINSLVMNADGSLWMAGGTSAAGLPVTANGVQTKPNGSDNYFVAKVVPGSGGTVKIPYLTYIGGSNAGETVPVSAGGGALAVDGSGNVYLTGMTFSADYPVTSNAYEKPFPLAGGCGGGPTPNSIATLTKFSPDLSQMLYSTVIGGKTESSAGGTEPDCNQAAISIHLDGQGDIWLTGTTGETDFPITSNALSSQLDTNGNAGVDFFLFELSADGSQELYGSYLGGSGFDYGDRAAWDANNNIWIIGNTNSTDFPVTSNAMQSTNPAGGSTNDTEGYAATLTELNPTATQILYSTYLGGSDNTDEPGNGQIAIDQGGNVRLTGTTQSANFPVTADAMQPLIADGGQRYNNTGDIFYTVLGTGIIGTVGPTTGGNIGDTTVTIGGAGFQSGATCQLVLDGTTIAATAATVNATGTSITCTFALSGASAGAYSIQVVNPNGGGTFTANSTFTVESGTGPTIWLNLVGRPDIRYATPSTFAVSYGNSGDTDAIGVVIYVSVPSGYTAALTSPLAALPTLSDFNPNALPTSYQMSDGSTLSALSNGSTLIPLFIPRIAPGQSGSLQFQITAPASSAAFTVQAYNWQPFADSMASFISVFGSSQQGSVRQALWSAQLSSANAPNPAQSQACFNDLVSAGAQLAGQIVGNLVSPASNCVFSAADFLASAAQTGLALGMSSTSVGTNAENFGQLAAGGAQAILNCSEAALAETPEGMAANAAAATASAALGLFGSGLAAANIANDCSPADYPFNPQAMPVNPVGALDPNEKSGPAGDGSTSHYIAGGKALSYNLAFENEVTATAPAAAVVVTDQLDPTKVDPTTVSLGPISWGASNVITPPSGVTSYATTYTPSGVTSYVVRVQGSLDTDNGLLKWTFQTIDPTTGQPPTDPTVGFLPPDTDGQMGQGAVVFNVMPKSGLSTGTQIANTATVVFDANAPINTDTWTNTIDVTAPVSAVTALPAQTTQTSFTVSWAGTDSGSGIASYNIYTSTNGGAFTLWQSAVSTTSATFTGTVGNTYGFLSQATDKVGNVEALRTMADTTSEIVASLPPDFSLGSTGSTASVSPGGTAMFTLNVTPVNGFNGAVSFACTGLPSEATCSFSPSTVTPNGTAASSTTMSIATTAPSGQALLVNPWSVGGLLAACALFPFFRRRGRALWMLLILCATCLAIGSIGCGGGGNHSTGPTNPGTPAGTSTVTVTATSGTGSSAITHTTTVTLTVQ